MGMLKEYHLDLLSSQDEERQIYFADVRSYFCAAAEFDFLPQIYAIRVFHGDYWFAKPQSASSIKFKVSTKFRGISPATCLSKNGIRFQHTKRNADAAPRPTIK